MTPINGAGRKKQMVRFATFYAASFLFLLVIFLALSDGGTVQSRTTVPVNQFLQMDQYAVAADSMLHARLETLQTLDKQYATALNDSGIDSRSDSLSRSIITAERRLHTSVDSLQKIAGTDTQDNLTRTLKAFNAELENRQVRIAIQNKLFEKNRFLYNDPIGVQLEVKGDLLDKDVKIADLEAQVHGLKSGQGAGTTVFMAPEQKSGEPVFRKAYDNLQRDFDRLTEINSRLRSSNDLLTIQLNNADGDGKDMNTSVKQRGGNADRKVDELNMELALSTVECNISRSDVHQIISNARQRRELLMQAMEILNGLKNSSNTEVQKIVQQKIDQINKISATVRD